MYRVVVKDKGKYNNARLGERYCFTKGSAAYLAANFMAAGCDCEVEELIRIHSDVFCWSEAEVSSDIWDKAYAILDKLTAKED